VERRVCPWLRDLLDSTDQATGPSSSTPQAPSAPGSPDSPDWRARLAAQRAVLGRPHDDTGPSPALGRLHAWRDEVARQARIEPHTVVDDQMLDTVVRRHPRDRDELAAIPGMGRLLVDRIGDGLLDALHEPSSPLPSGDAQAYNGGHG